MLHSTRVRLIAAGALLLAGVVSTGASAAAAASPVAKVAPQISATSDTGDTGGGATSSTDDPTCVVGDVSLPVGEPLAVGEAVPVPEGEAVTFEATVGADGTVVDADGNAIPATGVVVVGGDLPQEVIDQINADTDAMVAALHEAGFDVEVTTDESGVRTPQIDPSNADEMAALDDWFATQGGSIGIAVAGATDGVAVDASVDAPIASCGVVVAAEPAPVAG